MTSLSNNVRRLSKEWSRLSSDLSQISATIEVAQIRRNKLLDRMRELVKTFEYMGDFPPNFVIPKELIPQRRGTIGDFIQVILDEYGELTRSEMRTRWCRAA